MVIKKDDRINIRIDEELKQKVKDVAKKENRTLSNYIENVLRKEVENNTTENK